MIVLILNRLSKRLNSTKIEEKTMPQKICVTNFVLNKGPSLHPNEFSNLALT